MRTSRAVIVAGGSAAIIGAGWIAAPKSLTDPTDTPTADASGEVFVGPAVQNIKGTYQLQIVVDGGTVTDVQFLQAGSSAAQSVGVNNMALPILRERILAAQDWDVEYVSGASFTSPAMIESAEGAFQAAGLG